MSEDCMTFPDTVEEFMEQYKLDGTELGFKFTNGTEYVPVFRMKEWFEHLENTADVPGTNDGDMISRTAAMTEIQTNARRMTLAYEAHGEGRVLCSDEIIRITDAMDVLRAVPSAQQERKKGKWIEYIPEHGKCPYCGNQIDLLGGKENNFCGECGADMRGKQDEVS